MSEDRTTSDWFEIPKEFADDLDLPEGESGEIKGGAVDYFLKYDGAQAYLKLSASPQQFKQNIQSFSWGAHK